MKRAINNIFFILLSLLFSCSQRNNNDEFQYIKGFILYRDINNTFMYFFSIDKDQSSNDIHNIEESGNAFQFKVNNETRSSLYLLDKDTVENGKFVISYAKILVEYNPCDGYKIGYINPNKYDTLVFIKDKKIVKAIYNYQNINVLKIMNAECNQKVIR
ncbi:hypothetical protein [Hymenobacter rubripertinctus]|uniref:hypothetical protein n=1 Tax=Hymenobacter rubripertinctus TaxID=2029981 RepID=UPI0011C43327|nr:hypothetical protein [Hymenobacter rubripertinctus]